MRKPTAFDVFSGCGGTTQGLRDAGFRVIGGLEFDSLAVQTYKANHKHVTVWEEDIRDVSSRQILKSLEMSAGDLDLMVGCPPCQSFSSLKRLNGGKRVRDKFSKDLVFELLKLVKGLRPKALLIENVPGLLTDYRFSEVRAQLQELGYSGSPIVQNAADFGVPQRRRRLVYMASRLGTVKFSADTSIPYRVVRDAIGHLPPPTDSDDPLHAVPERRSDRVMRRIKAIPHDGGSRHSLGKSLALECHRNSDGFKDVYGRMSWDEVAPTITSGCVNPSKGRFLHPDQDRAITLREAALLQSFPEEYWFSLEKGKYAAALMIGNAFPPLFVKAHAIAIRQHLQKAA
jgi:DNA (cytosine-5)-methyltransferase 1